MQTAQQQARSAGCVKVDGPFGTFTIVCPRNDSVSIFIAGEEYNAWAEAAYESAQVAKEN